MLSDMVQVRDGVCLFLDPVNYDTLAPLALWQNHIWLVNEVNRSYYCLDVMKSHGN